MSVFRLLLLALLCSGCEGFFADRPPTNPYLSQGAWSLPHVKTYRQDTTEIKGPHGPSQMLTTEDLDIVYSSPITACLAYSTPYPDGKQVLWASQSDRIVKYDASGDGLKVISTFPVDTKHFFSDDSIKNVINKMDSLPEGEYRKYIERFEGLVNRTAIFGAHSVLDKDNTLFVAQGNQIVAYGDAIQGDRKSDIVVKRTYDIPLEHLDFSKDWIVGLNMTFDGTLIFVLTNGIMGAVSRDFIKSDYTKLGEDLTVSNSIAIDEEGGIYVVTSHNMQRVQWVGDQLSRYAKDGAWVAPYETGIASFSLGGRGRGSGSTPTLMGTKDGDKLVVITDGREIMNIVFFWRDQIPENWEKIIGTLDKRIAAQVPVTFGNPYLLDIQSERSVIVHGYGAVVVNNSLRTEYKDPIISALMSGDPAISAYGMEKFEWDPQTKKAKSIWSNPQISVPTSISTLSSTSNIIYTNGQREGNWTIEGICWKTGKSIFYYLLGKSVLFNACYSGVQLLPDGDIIYGTFGGVIRIKTPS